MIAPEKKHFANCGDLMSATSWQFVAAGSIIQKRCRAAQEKVDVAMSRNRSLWMSDT
jgi:hypothetical protein